MKKMRWGDGESKDKIDWDYLAKRAEKERVFELVQEPKEEIASSSNSYR